MEAGAAAETEPLLPPRSWRAARGGECVAEGGVLPRLSADCFRRPGGFLERRCRASGLGRPLRPSVRRSAAVQLPLAAVGSEPRSESFFLTLQPPEPLKTSTSTRPWCLSKTRYK